MCQQTKCVLYGVYTYRDELPVFVLNCVFDFCKNKKSAICVFERKMFMNKKKLSPGCSNEVEADAEVCEAVASMEQRRNCERRV